MTASEAGQICASEAIGAGGPDPFDHNGECLLPMEPLIEDWRWFENTILGRKPNADEIRDFERSFAAAMRDWIERATIERA